MNEASGEAEAAAAIVKYSAHLLQSAKANSAHSIQCSLAAVSGFLDLLHNICRLREFKRKAPSAQGNRYKHGKWIHGPPNEHRVFPLNLSSNSS
jgi:hypothetical protein